MVDQENFVKKTLLILLCLFPIAFFIGCRSGVYGDYSSVLPKGGSSVSGNVTATLAGGSMRAVAGSTGVAGAYVWLEERPDLNATADVNGYYVIDGVPAGTFNVVARFIQGNTHYKTRQKAVVVEDNENKDVPLNVVEAKNIVKGQLFDEDGNPLPKGTKLHLWGEEFEIIDEKGNFESPPIPDLDLEDLLQDIIVNRGQANQFIMPVSFVSDDKPLEVKIYVPSNPAAVNLLPKVALVALVDGKVVSEVNADAPVTIQAIVHPADTSADNINWVAPGLGTLGETTVVSGDRREKIWTAPATSGRAEIKVEVTSSGKTAFAVLPVTVKGPPAPTQHNVTFNSNGGSAVTLQTVDHGVKATEPSPAPTKAGHTFGGWYKESALTTAWNFATDTVNSATTLYAKWSLNSYQVTFNSNGGSAVTSQTVDHGAKAAEPSPAPTKAGHTFGGWYKESALTNVWNFATDTVTSATTLYAKWSAAYTITFNKNGGDTDADPASKIVAQGSTLGQLPVSPTKARMYFRGWNTNSSGTGTAITADTAIAGNITVYAIFSHFEAGSGTVADPYHVKKPYELYMAGTQNYWSNNFIQMTDIDLDHNTLAIEANNDWYSSTKGWSSYRGGSVRGIYDGNNKTIANLYMKETETYTGLFYTVSNGATVKNVRLISINIEGKDIVGGLTGMNYGLIKNCSVSGNVKGNNRVGGLVGFNYASGDTQGTVEQCSTNCTITVSDGYAGGGMVGWNTGLIRNSYTAGTLHSTGAGVGGFSGYERGSITNCYSVTIISNKGSGFAAEKNSSVILNSFWDTQASGAATSIGGTGKTTVQMKTAATFDGWDVAIWNIQDGAYPTLK